MTDLTSSYYALVVLATATMGLSSYLHNHYAAIFLDQQKRMKVEWDKRQNKHKNFNFSEEVRKEIDNIDNQKPAAIFWPIAALASVLPYSAAGQIANIIGKVWSVPNLVGDLMAITLIAWYGLCFIATISIIISINKLSRNTETIKDSVDSVLNLADAECRGNQNNGQGGATMTDAK